jgi:hypothetical protein
MKRRPFLWLALTSVPAAVSGQSLASGLPTVIHPVFSGEDRI